MDFTGRAMEGFLYIAPEGTAGKAALGGWVDESAAFVKTVKRRR
jgi:hypothetical protein